MNAEVILIHEILITILAAMQYNLSLFTRIHFNNCESKFVNCEF